MKTNKTVFTLRVHSIVCEITNSSSELFVGTSQSKENIIELIEAIYPNYQDEYEEIKNIDDLTAEELDQFFDYSCSAHMWPASKSNYRVLEGFTFDELYTPDNDGKPAWNGEIQYRLKNNDYDPEFKWHRAYVTNENLEEIKNKLDPKREMYFLYSIDDNPNWEQQERLMCIMNRYHLG